jgi:hypothetical protein
VRKIVWWAAVAAAGAGSPLRAEAIPGSEFTVALWQGFGMTDKKGGRVHCYAATKGMQGEGVMFQLGSDNRFALILTLVDVQFQTGQVLDVSIWTNVKDAIAVPATATDETGLAVIFTDSPWAVDYLSDGQLLTVTGEGFHQTLSIASANLALEKAQECLADHAAPEQSGAAP